MLVQAFSVLQGAIPGDSLDYTVDAVPTSSSATALSAGNDTPSTIKNIALASTRCTLNFNGLNVTAVALNVETYVHVRWVWLTVPMVLIVTGILFLGLAMIETTWHKVEVWKSSSLPLIYHSLDEEKKRKVGMVNTLNEMEREAGKTNVGLQKRDDGEEWVLATLE